MPLFSKGGLLRWGLYGADGASIVLCICHSERRSTLSMAKAPCSRMWDALELRHVVACNPMVDELW